MKNVLAYHLVLLDFYSTEEVRLAIDQLDKRKKIIFVFNISILFVKVPTIATSQTGVKQFTGTTKDSNETKPKSEQNKLEYKVDRYQIKNK